MKTSRKKKVAKASRRLSKELTRTAPEFRQAEVSTLVRDFGSMIDAARRQVAVAANAALTTLYWQLGPRVARSTSTSRYAFAGSAMGIEHTCRGTGSRCSAGLCKTIGSIQAMSAIDRVPPRR